MLTLHMIRHALAVGAAGPPPEPDGQSAAVALILVPGSAAGLDVLFIRRAVRAGDPWSGQVGLPGGRRAAADRDLVVTAVRETQEEVAVNLQHAERLGTLADLPPRTPVLPPIVVRPFVFALTARPSLVPSVEVQSAFWVSLAALRAPGVRCDITLPLQGGSRTGPAYVVGDDTIWGMTERIVTSFFEAIGTDIAEKKP
ncbi:MAG TPA: CoA pyrophosphatase [Gemmatimonadales bacterium]|nr:CoA pyrophosphatase [Gemmatimonadales bacterium]